MVPLKQKLINLINVKTIVTFTVCTVFAVLALRGETGRGHADRHRHNILFRRGTKKSAGDNGKR